MSDLYGDKALKERQCQNWFRKFRSGDFSLKDEPRSGRPNEVDDDQIKALIELDRHITEREIGEKLNIPKSTVHYHIKSLGLLKKLDIWVPHELKEIHLTNRINACDMHLKRNEFDTFLKRIITGDEKWIVYNNVRKKDHGPSMVNQLKPLQRLISTKRRLCCLFGGIGRVWYILSCFQGTKRLIRMFTVNNWTK